MGQSVLRRVLSPLLTLTVEPPEFVTIPLESVVDVLVDLSRPDDLAEPGFHRVRWNGQDFRAFTRDIRERTCGQTRLNDCGARTLGHTHISRSGTEYVH